MIPEAAWNLVPESLPINPPPWALAFAEQSNFSPREFRAYVWAMHLLRLQNFELSFEDDGPFTLMPGSGILDVTAGFVPFREEDERAMSIRKSGVPTVRIEGIDYAFGIVVGHVHTEFPVTARRIVNAEIAFLLLFEKRNIVLQSPPHPMGVVSTCYAKPRYGKRYFGPHWSDGIITARHTLSAVGFSAGVSVPMSSGTSCKVADIDPGTTIDAVILDCGTVPSAASLLPMATATAPGSKIEIRTASRILTGQALRVFDHPTSFSIMFGHRVFIDVVGVVGDSGSLVRSSGSLDAIGIYMGTTGSKKGVAEGIVQSIRQVVEYFEVELLD